ncbi:unnamed protein product [Schistocephalus solidus]|uniref:Uncharacterized protein n=1 Tax=Schistocephalus solidus TaxID=70667 RepID=A0A183SN32_SCHSO|nr:unnamed protein product [Schistocephalus solidus]
MSITATTTADTTSRTPTNTETTSDVPAPATFTITTSTSNEDSILTFTHCNRTVTSRIGLAGHLRSNQTLTGTLVLGDPKYTRRIHLHFPQ